MQLIEHATTTREMLQWPLDTRTKLKHEIDALFRRAFPRMPEDVRTEWIDDCFVNPGGEISRQVLLFRNEVGGLRATALFDRGSIEVNGQTVSAIYVLSRTISPMHQGKGLVDLMMRRVLDWRPDFLLTTCAHSSSLHSWIKVPGKGMSGYEVYPRLETVKGRETLITVPREHAGFVLELFRKLYLRVVRGNTQQVDDAVVNMTEAMVRRSIYPELYDFDPWRKFGRQDKIAEALKLRTGDGVVLVMRKVR